MVLNPERVGSWLRADDSDLPHFAMTVDDLVTDPVELRTAIDAGMRIMITMGAGANTATSLGFLRPVIDRLQHLWVGTPGRITDIEVLADARNLRSLAFAAGSCEGRVDLSGLPVFEEFEGPVTRAAGSALRNPGLRFLRVEGAIPKTFSRVSGPVEIFEQSGARSQVELPVFEQPHAMRKLWRAGPARFDLAQIAGMTRLAELMIGSCDDLIGLSELSSLTSLEKLEIKYCTSKEPWEDPPPVPWAFLCEVSPAPSAEFAERKRADGWLVHSWTTDSSPVLTVDEAGDEGDSWGVFMSRFDDLADAVDLLDGSGAGGMHGELFLLGVVHELRSQGIVLDPEPDSESGFTAVYFPDRRQAEQVYERAQELLAADAETQLRYLRAGTNA